MPTELSGRASDCSQRCQLKHRFGHCSDGLANLLAFAFHSMLDGLRGLWHQAQAKLGTRDDLFTAMRVPMKCVSSTHWTALLKELKLQIAPDPACPPQHGPAATARRRNSPPSCDRAVEGTVQSPTT